MVTRKAEAATIQKDWDTNPRWQGIKRGYSAEDVVRLRGSVRPGTPLHDKVPISYGILSIMRHM